MNVGSLQPHWLDDHFRDPNRQPATVAAAIVADGNFKRAVERAVACAFAAYHKQKEIIDKHPGMAAPLPEQAARVEFGRVIENFVVGNG